VKEELRLFYERGTPLLKIGHVVSYPYHGGIQEYVLNLVREQSKKHEVTIFTSQNAAIKKVRGVRYCQCHPFLTLFRTPFVPSLYARVLQGDLDIVHVHFPFPLASDFACFLARVKKCAVVATYHCEIEMDMQGDSSFLYAGLKSFHDNFLLSTALRRVDRIIVTTKSFFETSRILKRFSDKVEIIPAGVDVDRFRPNYEYPRKLLFVGRIIPEKGVEYLIKSLQFGDFDLVVLGKPVSKSYYSYLLDLTKQLGVTSRVHFTGFVPSDELPKYYQDAGAVVLPSINRLEAFGIVVLEGFASGKPAIVTDLPGPSSLVTGGYGMVVPKRDPEAVAKAANGLFESGQIAEIGKKARELAESEYSWSRISERIENMYSEIV
jgi:glycosyltransferase involved in cell wall biosynthesis